jgi:hypothetical protein
VIVLRILLVYSFEESNRDTWGNQASFRRKNFLLAEGRFSIVGLHLSWQKKTKLGISIYYGSFELGGFVVGQLLTN